MKYPIKSMIFGGAILFALSMCLTSCEGALDDVFGEWDKPAPSTVTPSDEGTTTVKVTGITLSQSSIKLTMGGTETQTLTVTVAPDDATDKTVTWSSEDTGIATVVDGVVTAVSAGTVVIKATAKDGSGVEGKCTVKVLPPALMSGKFSVGASQQVQFSRGNLQATYDGTAWSWDFAVNQWDFIGDNTITTTGNGNTSIDGDGTLSAAGTVDLFGWVGNSTFWTATANGVAIYGISNSTDVANYGSTHPENLKSDWGNTIGTGWRTLKQDEWEYMFNTRTSANQKYGLGIVDGVKGMIIIPDTWTLPTGLSFTPGLSDWTNSYTTDKWSQMEAAGAVFLPSAGVRDAGTGDVNTIGESWGWYWSSTSSASSNAINVRFYSGFLSIGDISARKNGQSVRLVQDVPTP